MNKYQINVTFTTLSDQTSEQVVVKLYDLLKQFETNTIVGGHSLYRWEDPLTGNPYQFNHDGTIKVPEFDIKNIATDIP